MIFGFYSVTIIIMPRKLTTRNCLFCNKTFYPAISETKRGNGKFCSLSCICHYRNKHYLVRTIKTETKICAFCHKKFQHIPYRNIGKFCSLSCLNNSQRGKQPGHPQQNIRRKLKEIAFKEYGEKCEVCDYSLSVDIHHLIPRSEGGTNDMENISVLCPNHHREYHIGLLTKEDIAAIRNKNFVEMGGYEPPSRTVN